MTQEHQAPEGRATWINIGSIIIVVLICLFIVSIIPINGNPPILCSINNNTPVIDGVACPKETLPTEEETATPNSSDADATAAVDTADCLSLTFDDDFESGLSSCWETINAEVIAIDDNTVLQLDGMNTTAVAEISDVRRENFCMQFRVRRVSDVEDNLGSLSFNFRISESGNYGVIFHFAENTIDFGKTIDSAWEEVMPSAEASFARNNEWMEVLVIAAGVYYFVYIDGQVVISASDSSSITNGYLAWSVPENGGIVQIDDVRLSDTC